MNGQVAGASPRSLVLSGTELDAHSATALSDLLTIEWGLRKLVLKECNLDELVCSFCRSWSWKLIIVDVGTQTHIALSADPKLAVISVTGI
jgi:hypothetical protein